MDGKCSPLKNVFDPSQTASQFCLATGVKTTPLDRREEVDFRAGLARAEAEAAVERVSTAATSAADPLINVATMYPWFPRILF